MGGIKLAWQERKGGCCREPVREIRCCWVLGFELEYDDDRHELATIWLKQTRKYTRGRWLRGKVQGSGGLESGGRFWRNM